VKKTANGLEYWIVDPFVMLKNRITEDEYQIISTFGYVSIKVNFFLGDVSEWSVELKESPWGGYERSLWQITRK